MAGNNRTRVLAKVRAVRIPDDLTPTQRAVYGLLSDGQPHSREELHACLDPDGMPKLQAIQYHVSNIRRQIRLIGQDIFCLFYGRTFRYVLADLVGAARHAAMTTPPTPRGQTRRVRKAKPLKGRAEVEPAMGAIPTPPPVEPTPPPPTEPFVPPGAEDFIESIVRKAVSKKG